MFFYIYISIFFYNAFYSCCENITDSKRYTMKVNRIADGLLAILNQNKNESERIKELREKLTRVNSYEIDKDRFYTIISNVTRHNHFNKTNFYEALQDRDHNQLSNESKPFYVKIKEKMNRDDVLCVLAVRGKTATKKLARKMLLKENSKKSKDNKAEYQGEALNNAIDKFIAESSKDEHNYTEDENMYKFWDPAEELRLRKEYYNPDGRRIYKGERTYINHYPFMVSIHIQNRFWCGGVLYWIDMVITSAACLQLLHNNHMFRENPNVVKVMVGSNFTRLGAGGEKISVTEVFFHPSYNPRTLDSNIAMMRLRRAVVLSYHRVPKIIDITHVPESPSSTSEVMLLGWGVKKGGQSYQNYLPMFLQMKIVPIYPFSFCQEVYGKQYINRNMFCAGTITTGEGACSHDAGGPAVLNGKLVGIISFGPATCGFVNAPTVFTNVGVFSDWIETVNESMSAIAPTKRLVKASTTVTISTPGPFFYSPPEHVTYLIEAVSEIATTNQEQLQDLAPFQSNDTSENATENMTDQVPISNDIIPTATMETEQDTVQQDDLYENMTQEVTSEPLQISTKQEDIIGNLSQLRSPYDPMLLIPPLTTNIVNTKIWPKQNRLRKHPIIKHKILQVTTGSHLNYLTAPSTTKVYTQQNETTNQSNNFAKMFRDSLVAAMISGKDNKQVLNSTASTIEIDFQEPVVDRSSESILKEAANHVEQIMRGSLNQIVELTKDTEPQKNTSTQKDSVEYEYQETSKEKIRLRSVDDKMQVLNHNAINESGFRPVTPIHNSEKDNSSEAKNQLNIDLEEYLEATMHEKDAEYKELKEELTSALQNSQESVAAQLKREIEQLNSSSPIQNRAQLPNKQEDINDKKQMLKDLLQWANKNDVKLLNELLSQTVKNNKRIETHFRAVLLGDEAGITGTESYIHATTDNKVLQPDDQYLQYEQYPDKATKMSDRILYSAAKDSNNYLNTQEVAAGRTKMYKLNSKAQQFQEQSNSLQSLVKAVNEGSVAQRNPEVPWDFMDMHPVQQRNQDSKLRRSQPIAAVVPQQTDWPDYREFSQNKIGPSIGPAMYDLLPPEVAATAFIEDVGAGSRNLKANGLEINPNF